MTRSREEWVQQIERSRQIAEGPEPDQLLRIIGRLQKERALTKRDRAWLLQLLGQILYDVDVRDRFHVATRPGRKKNPDLFDRDLACAVWIARHRAASTVGQAKFDAEKVFGMSEDQVHRAWLKHRRLAKMIAG